MNKRFFIIFYISLVSKLVPAQETFLQALSAFSSKPDYNNASIGIHFTDLISGKTLFKLNAEKMLIPASTMKVVTSAAALEILGSNYQFITKIGYTGRLEKNKIKGDLVVLGGGDPALGSEYFQNHYFNFLEHWVQKIKETGISKIEGDLVLDGSIYNTEKIPDTWIWEDIGNYYGAGANALTIYDNLFRISFRSPAKEGKLTNIISIYPKINDIHINNKVISSNIKSDQAYVFGSPLDKTREIRGTIPKNRNAFTIKAAIHHPEELLANELLKLLIKEGILLRGKIKYKAIDKRQFQCIYCQQSPTLDKIVKVLNYESINLFAEHLVKQIAYEKKGVGSRIEGIKIISDYWKSKGILDEIFMEDGSGLSHFNAISPNYFTSLLKIMQGNDAFLNSLPPAGEGTMYQFDKNMFPGNTFRAKSGSMTRVRCYVGYLQTNSGKNLAFSVMVNHFSGSHSALINEIEKLLILAKQSF